MTQKKSSYQRLKEKLFQSDNEAKVLGERLRISLRNLDIVVAHIDREMKYIWVYNPGNILLPENALNHTDKELFSEMEAAKLIDFKLNVIRKGRDDSRVVEMDLKQGKSIYNVNADPIFDQNGEIVGLIFAALDITEQKQRENKLIIYQEKLKALTMELAILEGRERRRIAQAIHDELGQNLALAKIELGALNNYDLHPKAKEHLDESISMIDNAIKETRSMTFELSPPILFNLGFEPAVEWLLENRTKPNGPRLHFCDDKRPKPLDKDTRILLFQIIRELVSNVIKHARAKNATVSIREENSNIIIELSDDGIGFDKDIVFAKDSKMCGFGLFSIQERLDFIGGTMDISTEPDSGTKILITSPLS